MMQLKHFLIAVGLSWSLLACSEEPHQLKSVVVDFPEPDIAQVKVESDRDSFQYSVPVTELENPELLEQRLNELPEELKPEVMAMLAAVEPPPTPLTQELSESVKALEKLLGSLGQDVARLKDDLAEKAEQSASSVAAKIQREYVEHLVELVEKDQLTEEEIKLLEQALIERHRRKQN